MDLLGRREHSTRELRVKLCQRGFEPALVETTLDRLEAEGLLSDARFAEAFLHSRAKRGQGPVRIHAELAQRGVGPDVIDNLTSEGYDWCLLAAKARVKKFGSGAPRNYTDRSRQARFLTYRGFSADQVKAALELDPDSD